MKNTVTAIFTLIFIISIMVISSCWLHYQGNNAEAFIQKKQYPGIKFKSYNFEGSHISGIRVFEVEGYKCIYVRDIFSGGVGVGLSCVKIGQ